MCMLDLKCSFSSFRWPAIDSSERPRRSLLETLPAASWSTAFRPKVAEALMLHSAHQDHWAGEIPSH